MQSPALLLAWLPLAALCLCVTRWHVAPTVARVCCVFESLAGQGWPASLQGQCRRSSGTPSLGRRASVQRLLRSQPPPLLLALRPLAEPFLRVGSQTAQPLPSDVAETFSS